MILPTPARDLPLALRLAGCWIIWAAWCSASGWLLSGVHALNGLGSFVMLPALFACGWFWLKSTAPRQSPAFNPVRKFLQRLRRPAPLLFVVIALLSLISGALYQPWSTDAVSYRLPRVIYWWNAHHWFWIGTVDGRLDFSSTGFEWQMLPLLELTHGDRFLFLLNWIPFLLMPGLVFSAFRGLGVNGRSARRWMWLLPSGYCFALQSSGLQNDGYSVNYLLAAIVFAVAGFWQRRIGWVLLSLLSTALLTGAKLSNLPLLLPLLFIVWPALQRTSWVNGKTLFVLVIAFFCSFAPTAFHCWKNTGDWGGNPTDQWNIKTYSNVGGIMANGVILLNDSLQLPYFPARSYTEPMLSRFNDSAFITRLKKAHGQFYGFHFNEMAYEGSAGLGFGVGIYTLLALGGGIFLWRRSSSSVARSAVLPLAWRLSLWLVWISYLFYLAKLGSYHSARIAAPYYPLLLIGILRCPAVITFERKKFAGILAVGAAATVLPVILLTPARPLIPIQTVAKIIRHPSIEKVAEKYQFWSNLRDDLAPVRAQLPPDANRVGFAAGFRDTCYGLCKPLGSRTIVELGVPMGSELPPPPDLKYAVVTDRGLEERYHTTLPAWLQQTHGRIIFECRRNTALDTRTVSQFETWYLLQFDPGSAVIKLN